MRFVGATCPVSQEHALQEGRLPSACTSEPTQVDTNSSQVYELSEPLGLGSPHPNLQSNGSALVPPATLPPSMAFAAVPPPASIGVATDPEAAPALIPELTGDPEPTGTPDPEAPPGAASPSGPALEVGPDADPDVVPGEPPGLPAGDELQPAQTAATRTRSGRRMAAGTWFSRGGAPVRVRKPANAPPATVT
jgi:hypothetical protein